MAVSPHARTHNQIVAHFAQLPNKVAWAIGRAWAANRNIRQLTDHRDPGKPSYFKGDEAEFAVGSKQTENYILSANSLGIEVPIRPSTWPKWTRAS